MGLGLLLQAGGMGLKTPSSQSQEEPSWDSLMPPCHATPPQPHSAHHCAESCVRWGVGNKAPKSRLPAWRVL